MVSGGHEITIWLAGNTVTVALHIEEFPQVSETVKTTVLVPTSPHPNTVWSRSKVTGVQLSEDPLSISDGSITSPIFTVMSWVIQVGASISSTITRKEQVSILPPQSSTCKKTLVDPLGYGNEINSPSSLNAPNIASGQLSLNTICGKMISAEHKPGSVLTIISSGHVTLGNSSSITIKLNEQVTSFPPPSVKVQVNSVVSFGYGSVNASPSPLVNDKVVSGQLSIKVGNGIDANGTIAVQIPSSVPTVKSGGQITVGGSSSITVTTVLHVSIFPPQSVTVYISLFVPNG